MTTLADIITQPLPSIEELRGLWLVFPAELCEQLDAAQDGETRHRATPITLADGRAALSADILTEIHEQGIFAAQFSRLNPEQFALVEVTLLQPSDFPTTDSPDL